MLEFFESQTARSILEMNKKNLDTENLAAKNLLMSIKAFMEVVSRGSSKEEPILTSCIRAGFVKAYEFTQFAHDRLDETYAFHCVGTLRSICEDLIILRFVDSLSASDQKMVLLSSMLHSVDDSIRRQVPFFATFRPSQPVLNVGYDSNSLED